MTSDPNLSVPSVSGRAPLADCLAPSSTSSSSKDASGVSKWKNHGDDDPGGGLPPPRAIKGAEQQTSVKNILDLRPLS